MPEIELDGEWYQLTYGGQYEKKGILGVPEYE